MSHFKKVMYESDVYEQVSRYPVWLPWSVYGLTQACPCESWDGMYLQSRHNSCLSYPFL